MAPQPEKEGSTGVAELEAPVYFGRKILVRQAKEFPLPFKRGNIGAEVSKTPSGCQVQSNWVVALASPRLASATTPDSITHLSYSNPFVCFVKSNDVAPAAGRVDTILVRVPPLPPPTLSLSLLYSLQYNRQRVHFKEYLTVFNPQMVRHVDLSSDVYVAREKERGVCVF